MQEMLKWKQFILVFFNFGKRTKFLCDHRNTGNRHKKESKNKQVTNPTMARSAARKSYYLKVVSSSLTGRSSKRTFFSLHFQL